MPPMHPMRPLSVSLHRLQNNATRLQIRKSVLNQSLVTLSKDVSRIGSCASYSSTPPQHQQQQQGGPSDPNSRETKMMKSFQEMQKKMDAQNEDWQKFNSFVEDDRAFQEAVDRSSSRFFLNGIEIPFDLCCPLTKSLFVDPVRLPSGNIFSRSALKARFQSEDHPTDPLTGELLHVDIESVTTCEEMQTRVKEFMMKHADRLQEAIEQQYNTLLKQYEQMSEKNPEILFQLGLCYAHGKGVKKDIERGFELIKRAADAGSVDACVEIGEIYAKQKNLEDSFEYYLKAANADNGYAAYRVGVAYLSGLGVEKSYEEALDYFTTAADLGDAGGFWGLGACFIRGIGTDKDIYQGYKCLEKAAEMGMVNAQHLVGVLLKDGKYIGRDSEAAAKWFEKAAESGHTSSMVTLGSMIINQRLNRPLKEAVQWFKKAAQAGDAAGFFNLSKCFEFGFGVKSDLDLARHCMKRARDLGFSVQDNEKDGDNIF